MLYSNINIIQKPNKYKKVTDDCHISLEESWGGRGMSKYGQREGLFLFLIILSCLVLGCSEKNSDLKVQNAEVINKENLNFRITWKAYSGRGEAIRKIVEGYNKSNQTGYQVTVVDGDEDLTTIENLLNTTVSSVSAEKIDVYMLPYRYVQYFGYKNSIGSLSDDFSAEKEYFYTNLWNLGVVEDKVYGIPWLGHTMGLVYNKDLLDRAGVDPAEITDLDALVLACEKVETSTDAMGIGLVGAEHNDISWMVNQFIYGFGGSLVSADGKKVTINTPQAAAALDFYKNTLGSHAQSSWKTDTGVEVMDAFRNQSIAFEIQGLWGITDIWKSEDPFTTGVIALDDIGLYPEVGPMMVALPATLQGEDRKAAIDFIRYLISKDAQEQIMNGEYSPEHDAFYPFRLPVRSDMPESRAFDDHPEFATFLSGFSKPSIDVPVPLWQQMKKEYYEPGLHQLMEDKISIDDFLTNTEQQGNLILNRESR